MTPSAFESEIWTSELPEAVFLENLDGNILDVNDGACDLLGYEREELIESIEKGKSLRRNNKVYMRLLRYGLMLERLTTSDGGHRE